LGEGNGFVFHFDNAWLYDDRCGCHAYSDVAEWRDMLMQVKMGRRDLKVCIGVCIFYFVVIAVMGVNGIWDLYFDAGTRVLVHPAIFMVGVSFFSFYSLAMAVLMYSCLVDLKRMNMRKRLHGHD
jgi:hypothetical protein